MNSKTDGFLPGLYEHYKSTPTDRRYYQVLGISEILKPKNYMLCTYLLYVIPEHRGARFQCRPLDMFLEEVVYKGVKQPRFKYVGQVLK